MHGGLYTLCYTPDGTFDELDNKMEYNTLLNVTIEVIGVFKTIVHNSSVLCTHPGEQCSGLRIPGAYDSSRAFRFWLRGRFRVGFGSDGAQVWPPR